MTGKWGIIVVDMQGDFTQWKKGSLAVPGADEDYIKSVEAATRQFKELGALVFGTQDWHPPDHASFVTSHPGKMPFETITIDGRLQVLWPPHCIQGTENARVLIDNDLFLAIVRKGQEPAVESYSGFQDLKGIKTEMDAMLRMNGIGKVVIYGLATDYCVRATSLDLLAAGYETMVVEGLCRGVYEDTAAAALDEMRRKGIRTVALPGEVIGEIRRETSGK